MTERTEMAAVEWRERTGEIIDLLHQVTDQLVALGYEPAEISTALVFMATAGTAQRTSGDAAVTWLHRTADAIEKMRLFQSGSAFSTEVGNA